MKPSGERFLKNDIHFSPLGTHLCPPFKMEEAESGGFIHLMRQKNQRFFFPSLQKGRVRDGYHKGKVKLSSLSISQNHLRFQTCSLHWIYSKRQEIPTLRHFSPLGNENPVYDTAHAFACEILTEASGWECRCPNLPGKNMIRPSPSAR